MIKVSRRFLILVFNLSVAVLVSLTAFSNTVAADPPDLGNRIKPKIEAEPVESGIEVEIDNPNEEYEKLKDDILKSVKESAIKLIEENNLKLEKKNKDADKEEDFWHIIFMGGIAVNFLFTIVFFIISRKSNFDNPKQKVNNLNKITQGNSKINPSPYDSDIEKEVAELQKEVKDSKKKLNEKLNDLAEVVKTLVYRFNLLEKSLNGTSDVKRESSTVTDTDSKQQKFIESSLPNTKITLAFNEMMSKIAKSTNWEGKEIRKNFAQKYQVVAFKCANTEARGNNPEMLPIFELSTEGKLWGIPLSDGNLAVFPSPILSDYESSLHYRGGMKELFGSNYVSGNYRKINVKKPAVITNDLKNIIKKGELELIKE